MKLVLHQYSVNDPIGSHWSWQNVPDALKNWTEQIIHEKKRIIQSTKYEKPHWKHWFCSIFHIEHEHVLSDYQCWKRRRMNGIEQNHFVDWLTNLFCSSSASNKSRFCSLYSRRNLTEEYVRFKCIVNDFRSTWFHLLPIVVRLCSTVRILAVSFHFPVLIQRVFLLIVSPLHLTRHQSNIINPSKSTTSIYFDDFLC